MAVKFLDLTGLSKFWNKCKNAFVAKDSNGNVKVTGALEVTGQTTLKGDLALQGQILGNSYGATFGNDVDIMKGSLLQLWDEEDNNYASLQCGTDGEIYFAKKGAIGRSPIATHLFVAAAVANAGHTKREIVDSLPGVLTKDPNTIYMLRTLTDEGGDNDKTDSFEEYMWIGEKWEKVGSSEVDLSRYSTTEQMINAISTAINDAHTAITETEINNLT